MLLCVHVGVNVPQRSTKSGKEMVRIISDR